MAPLRTSEIILSAITAAPAPGATETQNGDLRSAAYPIDHSAVDAGAGAGAGLDVVAADVGGVQRLKVVAVIFIGILAAIGFFDLGQEAYTLAALLLGIGALLDHGRKRAAG